MAGKEIMETNNASEILWSALLKNYEDDPRKSVLFAYKEDQLREEYTADKGKGKNDYQKLCSKYHETETASPAEGPEKVYEYLELVVSLFASDSESNYISSGMEKNYVSADPKNGIKREKDKSVLENFVDRWSRYFTAFGGDDLFPEKENIKKSDVVAAFRKFSLPDKSNYILDSAQKSVLKIMQEELLTKSVLKAVKEYVKKRDVSAAIPSKLLDFSVEAGFLGTGTDTRKNPDGEQIREKFVKVLQDIYAIEDPKTREEYNTAFIPVYIDCITGVSMCIIGKYSYKQHYELMKDLSNSSLEKNEFDLCPFPCVLTVLHFTDVSLMPKWSNISYEVETPLTNHMVVCGLLPKYAEKESKEQKKILEKYYDRVYDDYENARRLATECLAGEKDNWKNVVDSVSELEFYKIINNTYAKDKVAASKQEAKKQNEANQNAFDRATKYVKKKS